MVNLLSLGLNGFVFALSVGNIGHGDAGFAYEKCACAYDYRR